MTTDAVEEFESYPFITRDDLTVDDFYREMQQKGPIKVKLPFGEPIWLVTRYNDAKLVYGDRRFGKELGHGRDVPSMHGHAHDPNRLSDMDGPRHTRIRRLALGTFTPAKVRSMTPWIEGMADDLLDQMVATGQPADLIEGYAWPLPLKVLTGILGVIGDGVQSYRHLVDDLTGPASTPERRAAAWVLLNDSIRGLIEVRRTTETDDLLSAFVHARDDEGRLTEDELVNLALTMLLGGFETTAAQIGSSVFVLLSDRRLWQELVDTPELLPNAIEELWRWIPSFRFGTPMIRWAIEDVELSGGVVVKAGDPVLVEHQVANRDEVVFEDGSTIDFHRVQSVPHLSFAWGAHRCLGAHLAQLEIQTSLAKLLQRFPDLRLAVPADEVPWSPKSFLRSPASLPLMW